MHWIAASLLSALFHGVYELCTKHAVRDNAVIPVLFFSTLSGVTVCFAEPQPVSLIRRLDSQ
jgi:hypothetical protein